MASKFSGNFLYTTTLLSSSNGAAGTGFFFTMPLPEIDENASGWFIATNKHVVQSCDDISFYLNKRDPNTGRANHSSRVKATIEDINNSIHLVNHPDPDIDLCLINIAQAIHDVEQEEGFETTFLAFEPSMIPTKEELQHFYAMEDVVMVGYPRGLWDEVNNLPVMRKGVTATPVHFDYNGEEKFMADIACYRGSSGSPLFVHENGAHILRDDKLFGESQGVVLLGIAVEIPTEVAIGSIVPKNIPGTQGKEVIRADLNLGYFIKSYKLLDFIPIVTSISKKIQGLT